MTEKHGMETKDNEEEKDTKPEGAKKTAVFDSEHVTALIADLVSLSTRPASLNRGESSSEDGSSGTRTMSIAEVRDSVLCENPTTRGANPALLGEAPALRTSPGQQSASASWRAKSEGQQR